jgi:hypothetical protein
MNWITGTPYILPSNETQHSLYIQALGRCPPLVEIPSDDSQITYQNLKGLQHVILKISYRSAF